MPIKGVGLLSWKLKAAPVEREVDDSVVGDITSDMEDGCGMESKFQNSGEGGAWCLGSTPLYWSWGKGCQGSCLSPTVGTGWAT